MPVKKAKKSRKQRGGKVAGYNTWNDYTKSEYYRDNLKAGRNELLADMRRSYEPGWVPPADIDETKYKVPKSKLGQFIEDNHVISKLAGGVIGFASNLVAPGSGALTGPAATYGLQQLGLGKKHRRRPIGKPPQHGSGTILYKTQPYPVKSKPMTGGNSPFLLTNNSSFNRVKF